jgi:hypothetical protein
VDFCPETFNERKMRAKRVIVMTTSIFGLVGPTKVFFDFIIIRFCL